jgi:hypothetical protein
MQTTTRTTLLILALDRDTCPDFAVIRGDVEDSLAGAGGTCLRATRIFDDLYQFRLDRLTVSLGFCDAERPGWPLPGHRDGATALVLALTTSHAPELDSAAAQSRQRLGQLLVRRIDATTTVLDCLPSEREGGFDEDTHDAILDSLAWTAPVHAPAPPMMRLGTASAPARKAPPAGHRPLPSSAAATPGARIATLCPGITAGNSRSAPASARHGFEPAERLAERLSARTGPLTTGRAPDPEAELHAALRPARVETDGRPSVPIRLASQVLNGAAIVLMPPVGAAMMVHASLGRASLVASARALSLSGTAMGLGKLSLDVSPFSGFV